MQPRSSLTSTLLSRCIRLCISLILRSARWQINGANILKEGENGKLLCTWHGELAVNSYFLKQSGNLCWLVVSQHRDGQLIANILKKWGFPLIRGSTNSSGALSTTKKMLSLLKKSKSMIAITSDGPKGPRHEAKPGAIRVAQQCGADIILMRAHVSRFWQLNSWDKFIIPKPFSTITISIKLVSKSKSPEPSALAKAVSQQLRDCEPALVYD